MTLYIIELSDELFYYDIIQKKLAENPTFIPYKYIFINLLNVNVYNIECNITIDKFIIYANNLILNIESITYINYKYISKIKYQQKIINNSLSPIYYNNLLYEEKKLEIKNKFIYIAHNSLLSSKYKSESIYPKVIIRGYIIKYLI